MNDSMSKFFLKCTVVAGSGLIAGTLTAQNTLPPSNINIPHTESFPFFDLDYCHHRITTSSPIAQRYFNQGLAFLYAFNHDAAEKSFTRVVKEDPNCAMGYWGLAMSLGPILDISVSVEDEKKAFENIQKAQQLMIRATANEQAYIQALAVRFSNALNPDFKQLALNYKNALKKLHEQYPDDIDAAAFYADSALCLISTLWDTNGEPNIDTMDVVTALESALKKDPQHIGLNHFNIHLLEDSKYPERAWSSADRLAKVNPILSHLVHSAAHIYLLVGEYEAAIKVNEEAIKAVEEYLSKFGSNQPPIQSISHNQLFLVRSHVMAGALEGAKTAAKKLQDLYAPYFKKFPGMEFDYSVLQLVLLNFNQWKEVLQQPKPSADMKIATTIWHFSRAMASISLNEVQQAEQEQKLFNASLKEFKDDSWKDCSDFLTFTLQARLAESKKDISQAIQYYQNALAIQQNNPGEDFPFNWLLFASEKLGGCLLRDRQYQKAESVFRTDLVRHARNGRSLFGLWESLKEQKQLDDAFWVKEAFDRAWKGSDVTLAKETL